MGTNYYVAKNLCECCNRYDEEYHIGKSSMGWAFTFQGYKYDNLTTWKLWKEYLKNQIIKDEYGDTISYEEFVEMVETYKSPNYINSQNNRKNLSHNTQGKIDSRPWFNPEYDWDDEDGYSFTSREFS
jgi:hypothetical protein